MPPENKEPRAAQRRSRPLLLGPAADDATKMEQDLALLRDASMRVATKDQVFREYYWMLLGAPRTPGEFLAAPDVAVPIPVPYLKRLLDAATVTEEPYRSMGFRPVGADGKVRRLRPVQRPSQLAFLMWCRLGPLLLSWDEIAKEWKGLTHEWSNWRRDGKAGPPPNIDDRPEAKFAHGEWLSEYAAMPPDEGVGVETITPDEVKRRVTKRAGPSLDRKV